MLRERKRQGKGEVSSRKDEGMISWHKRYDMGLIWNQILSFKGLGEERRVLL